MHHRKRAFSHTLNVSIWNIISTVHPYNMFIRYVSPLTWRYYVLLTYLHDKPGMDWGEHCVANGCPCRLIVSFVFPQHSSLLGMMVPLRFTFSCRRRLRYGAVTRTSAFLRIVPIQRLVIWVLWKQCKLKILITPPHQELVYRWIVLQVCYRCYSCMFTGILSPQTQGWGKTVRFFTQPSELLFMPCNSRTDHLVNKLIFWAVNIGILTRYAYHHCFSTLLTDRLLLVSSTYLYLHG